MRPTTNIDAIEPAAAQTVEHQTIQSIEFGIGGSYKLGRWTPVAVEVRAGDLKGQAHVELVAPDGDGLPVRFSSEPFELKAGPQVGAILVAEPPETMADGQPVKEKNK